MGRLVIRLVSSKGHVCARVHGLRGSMINSLVAVDATGKICYPLLKLRVFRSTTHEYASGTLALMKTITTLSLYLEDQQIIANVIKTTALTSA